MPKKYIILYILIIVSLKTLQEEPWLRKKEYNIFTFFVITSLELSESSHSNVINFSNVGVVNVWVNKSIKLFFEEICWISMLPFDSYLLPSYYRLFLYIIKILAWFNVVIICFINSHNIKIILYVQRNCLRFSSHGLDK